MTRVLVARLDNAGDVLLAGPLVRAVAASGASVVLLCSPGAVPAARMLPGVRHVEAFDAPWIAVPSPSVSTTATDALIGRVRTLGIDEAIISTSFHQSPLPLALLMRLAGVGRIGAISDDFPGTLLDVRHHVDGDCHEVERNLSLGQACGHRLPVGDDGRLRVDLADRSDAVPAEVEDRRGAYVVVHPGASVPARTWSPARFVALVASLRARGTTVVVTGAPSELALTAAVAGGAAPADVPSIDLGGRLTLSALARVLAGARAVVVGNTGPAHLAAAVGTPVVSLFPPTVPLHRWRPWMVPHIALGDQDIACAGCRARRCPVEGHPCIDEVRVADVTAAVERLSPSAAVGAGDRLSAFLDDRMVWGPS